MPNDDPKLPTKSCLGEMARHIARVAARLFASQGYDATPVRSIVEAAGVTKPTLYYHFGSKEGLAQALLTKPMTEFVAELNRCLTLSDDPVANLEAQTRAHFTFMRDDPDRSRFFYALFFGPLSTSLSSELAGFGLQIKEAFREAILKVVDAGVVDSERADAFGIACRGTVLIHTMRFLYEPVACLDESVGEFSPDLAHSIVSDLIRGFGTSPLSPANPRD